MERESEAKEEARDIKAALVKRTSRPSTALTTSAWVANSASCAVSTKRSRPAVRAACCCSWNVANDASGAEQLGERHKKRGPRAIGPDGPRRNGDGPGQPESAPCTWRDEPRASTEAVATALFWRLETVLSAALCARVIMAPARRDDAPPACEWCRVRGSDVGKALRRGGPPRRRRPMRRLPLSLSLSPSRTVKGVLERQQRQNVDKGGDAAGDAGREKEKVCRFGRGCVRLRKGREKGEDGVRTGSAFLAA